MVLSPSRSGAASVEACDPVDDDNPIEFPDISRMLLIAVGSVFTRPRFLESGGKRDVHMRDVRVSKEREDEVGKKVGEKRGKEGEKENKREKHRESA